MVADIKELARQLRLAREPIRHTAALALEVLAGEVERLKEERDAAITDRFDAAADRIKVVAAERDRLAGEVASLTLSNDLFQGAQKKEAEVNTQLTIQLHAIRTERDRLKEALLDIKHFGAGFAQDRARKALGNAS